MKKILIFISLFILVGCSKNSEPTKAVETLFKKYQTLDTGVISDLELSSEGSKLNTNEQKEEYMKIMKMQYSDLKYEITDEKTEGDFSEVTANITVYDFYKAIKMSDDYLLTHEDTFMNEKGLFDSNKFINYKLKNMKETSDRIKYTIKLYLDKNEDEWKIRELDKSTLEKIHGTYNYENR